MDFSSKSKLVQIKIEKHKKLLINGKLDISLTNILDSEKCVSIIEECREYRERIFTPFITLMTFIKQVLDPDKSCKKAVSRVISERMSQNQKPCAEGTGAYCKARQKLPDSAISALVQEVGKNSDKRTPTQWKWKGRNVNVVDGTTLLMPDTIENQAEYPQHGQAEGIGLPIMRLIVIFSLATGVVLNYAMDAIRGVGTGEPSLLRRVLDSILEPGNILLGDCCYHSFFLLVDLSAQGCDGVFQAHAQWTCNFHDAKKLGKNDHIVTWRKPQRPEWMDLETYQQYPKKIKTRVCKVGRKTFITTLLSNKKYHKKEIGQLYILRWNAELYLRYIKTTMKMEMLSCKSPEMARKEISIHFLAYNIIRILMAESGSVYDVPPLRISFKNTVQFINSFMPIFICMDKATNAVMHEHMLRVIANVKVGKRPGRKEPRAVKRRPKPFPLLTKHRNIYRKELNNSKSKRDAA
jgi:hypothetical protein